MVNRLPGLDIKNASGKGKIFNDPVYLEKYRRDLFVLMPFAAVMEEIYAVHIRKVAKRMGLKLGRADDFFTSTPIMEDVWNAIHNSQIIIADCTGRNANVFYELGIAHTLRKPTILITQDENDVPFDLRHLRYILYKFTPSGMRGFEKVLQQAITSLRESED